MFTKSVYLAAALAIALVAFALGQLAPGTGVPFVALASTLWTAYVVARQRRIRSR